MYDGEKIQSSLTFHVCKGRHGNIPYNVPCTFHVCRRRRGNIPYNALLLSVIFCTSNDAKKKIGITNKEYYLVLGERTTDTNGSLAVGMQHIHSANNTISTAVQHQISHIVISQDEGKKTYAAASSNQTCEAAESYPA